MKLPVSEVVITLFFLYAIITYYNKRSVRSAPIAGIVIVSILYVTGQCTLAMLDTPGFYQAVFLFAVNLGFAFMFKMTWKQSLINALIIAVILLAADALTRALVGLLPATPAGRESLALTDVAVNHFNFIYLTGLLVARLVAFIIIRIQRQLRTIGEQVYPIRHWLIIMMIPVMSIAVCLGLVITLGNHLLRNQGAQILVIAGIIGINMLAFIMYDRLSAQSKKLIQNERAQNQLESDVRRYDRVVQQLKEFASILHDSRHHRETLYGLISTGENAAALQYLDSVHAVEIKLHYDTIVKSSPAVDVLLRRKTAEAENYGIKVLCNFEAEGLIPIDDDKLCLIFGNALDNAIEACRKLADDDERYIEIDVRYKNDRLTIRIANTSGPVNIVDNTCATTKSDPLLHGYGLENIKKTVGQNGGNSVIRYENGMFILSILFLL